MRKYIQDSQEILCAKILFLHFFFLKHLRMTKQPVKKAAKTLRFLTRKQNNSVTFYFKLIPFEQKNANTNYVSFGVGVY